MIVHPYYYNNITLGYDNVTANNIYFDLNSAYYLYDVNATEYDLYTYEYSYDYNCWNEIFDIPYELLCNSTKIGDCPDCYINTIPYKTNDCMGLQKRYLEISSFRKTGATAVCIKKKSIEPRLSGSIKIGNNTDIFDIPLEIGKLSVVSPDMKITLMSSIEKRGIVDVCKTDSNNEIVLDLLNGMDINDFLSRRVVDQHLITNFQESLLPYEIDKDLVINRKGVFRNGNSTYFFLYHMAQTLNDTKRCMPILYSDNYYVLSEYQIVINDRTTEIFSDKNCTKHPVQMPTGSPSGCKRGIVDDEDNLFCYDTGYLTLYSGKMVSQEIQDDFIIQFSYTGNYKAKQVFYDRCRVRSIEYINNTIYIYDCDDSVHLKNKYTGLVYRVNNGMSIQLPDGIYYLADFINSPLLYVVGLSETPSMYYAKDKFYATLTIKMGFDIQTVESKTTYILFYICFGSLVILVISLITIIIKCFHKKHNSNYTQVSTDIPKGKNPPLKKRNNISIAQRKI